MKIYNVTSLKNSKDYNLTIFIEKESQKYRILNLTKQHICPCNFNSYVEAVNDIYEYEKNNKIIINNIQEWLV